MTKRSSPAGSGRGRRGGSERRVLSHSTPSEAKPGSLWTCGPAPTPATTLRVCYRPPDCTRGSPHRWGVSSMIAWTFSMNSLVRVFLAVSSALGFRSTTSKGSSETLNSPDSHFEDAGNGPVVITWIGREHELYSGTFLISLVEHCVTFRHDRRLLSLLGFVHNWPTSRWPATKKENRFSLNGNGIMSSFLGRQFYRSTLYISEKWNIDKLFQVTWVL